MIFLCKKRISPKASEKNLNACPGCWTSAVAVSGQPWRQRPLAMAAKALLPKPPAYRGQPCIVKGSDSPPAIRIGFGKRGAVGKVPPSGGLGCCRRWRHWSSRRRGAIRKARFAGLAAALASWQARWRPRAIRSATRRWRPCWMAWAIAFRGIKKPGKAPPIRAGMPVPFCSRPG
jgi:hypothetical protein